MNNFKNCSVQDDDNNTNFNTRVFDSHAIQRM